MAKTHKLLILLHFLVIWTINSNAQITKKNLQGTWFTIKDDSLYYKSDTIVFYNLELSSISSSVCQTLHWEIGRIGFQSLYKNWCSEPPTLGYYYNNEKLTMKNEDYGQVFQLKMLGDNLHRFKIINIKQTHVYPLQNYISEFQLLRFDKLEDLKLRKYVDYIVFKVLNYFPGKEEGTSGTHNMENDTSTQGDFSYENEPNPKPMLVINGIPFNNYDILNKILLVETIEVKYLDPVESSMFHHTVNGVIVISISPKRFKQITK